MAQLSAANSQAWVFWLAVFAVVLALGGCFTIWRGRMISRLLFQAEAARRRNDYSAAAELLFDALWTARAMPKRERIILSELEQTYGLAGAGLPTEDYLVLIRQYERLSGRGSWRSWRELDDVARMKQLVIGMWPRLKNSGK